MRQTVCPLLSGQPIAGASTPLSACPELPAHLDMQTSPSRAHPALSFYTHKTAAPTPNSPHPNSPVRHQTARGSHPANLPKSFRLVSRNLLSPILSLKTPVKTFSPAPLLLVPATPPRSWLLSTNCLSGTLSPDLLASPHREKSKPQVPVKQSLKRPGQPSGGCGGPGAGVLRRLPPPQPGTVPTRSVGQSS